MGEVLASEGIFLNGALGGFDTDWKWHRECQTFYNGPRHLLTVAPTRSGKGACAIIPNLLCSARSVICIDPKGQNAAVTDAGPARPRATASCSTRSMSTGLAPRASTRSLISASTIPTCSPRSQASPRR